MFIVFLSTYVPIFKTLALVQSSKNVEIQFEYKVSDRQDKKHRKNKIKK